MFAIRAVSDAVDVAEAVFPGGSRKVAGVGLDGPRGVVDDGLDLAAIQQDLAEPLVARTQGVGGGAGGPNCGIGMRGKGGGHYRISVSILAAVAAARVTPEVRSGAVFVPYFVRQVQQRIRGSTENGVQLIPVSVEKEAA